MSEDLRIKAMEYALAARSNADQDVVELAERIHRFLAGSVDVDASGLSLKDLQFGNLVAGQLSQPPPIPDLVQQVASDAKPSQLGPESLSNAPPGMRGEMPDISNADQSPPKADPRISPEDRQADVFRRSYFVGECKPDDDARTRIISRAREAQFTE